MSEEYETKRKKHRVTQKNKTQPTDVVAFN